MDFPEIVTISDKSINQTTLYKDISSNQDGNKFWLEITKDNSKGMFSKFILLQVKKDNSSEEMIMSCFESLSDLKSGKNVQTELTLYKDATSQSSSSGNSIEVFWKEFQTAVIKGDKNKVAEMTVFPLIEPIEGGEISKVQFITKFASYFNKKNTTEIKKTNASKLEKKMESGESVYFLALNFGDSNWTFYFAQRNGTFKLIKIEFAG